jgi:hypothetical protein
LGGQQKCRHPIQRIALTNPNAGASLSITKRVYPFLHPFETALTKKDLAHAERHVFKRAYGCSILVAHMLGLGLVVLSVQSRGDFLPISTESRGSAANTLSDQLNSESGQDQNTVDIATAAK